MDLYVSKTASEKLNSYLTIKEALLEAKEYDIIHIEGGTYFEKLKISTPNLTLIGDGNTLVTYNNSNGTIIPDSEGGDGVKTYGTTGSASVTITETAVGFKASNIIFQNSFNRLTAEHNGTQAVAVKASANSLFDSCSFISTQDTLYPDLADKIIFNNCYIEGDVDFIFGGANALFYNCNITAIDLNNNAYFIAPDTFSPNKYGFCFAKCNFAISGKNNVYLGRPWYPSKSPYPVLPKALFYKCKLDQKIKLEFVPMNNSNELPPHDMRLLLCNVSNHIYSDTTLKKERERINFIKENKKDN